MQELLTNHTLLRNASCTGRVTACQTVVSTKARDYRPRAPPVVSRGIFGGQATGRRRVCAAMKGSIRRTV